MNEQINNGETQPNTETETLLRQMEQRLSDKIDRKFAELKDEIKSESDIKKMIKSELTTYSTTEQMQQFVAGLTGGINRSVNEFKAEMSGKVGKIEETFTKFSSRAEEILGRLRYDLDEVGRQADTNQQNISVFKANQETMLVMLKDTNETLRGVGRDGGLVADIEHVKAQQIQMIEALNKEAEIGITTNKIAESNTRAIEQIVAREEKREKDREKRNATIERWSLRIIKAGIAGFIALGGGGGGLVALDAISKSLGG